MGTELFGPGRKSIDDRSPKNKWLKINNKYSKLWPNITKKKEPPKDAEKYKSEKNKYDKYFSEKPGG